MAGPLTWQQVTAPDFGDALQARASGATMISDAVKSLGGVLNGMEDRREQRVSNTALEKMLQYRDVAGWDQALQNGGLAALGVTADQLSPEMVSMITEYRSDLERSRSNDQINARNRYNLERQRIGDQRSDLNYERGEEERARTLEALTIADRIAGEALSPEAAMVQARNMNLDPRLEAEVFGQLSGANPVNWQVSPTTKLDAPVAGQINRITESLDSQERALNYSLQNNPAAQLWIDAPNRYTTYDTPLNGLTSRLQATLPDDEKETFGQSRGKVTDLYNKFRSDFPDVPPAVVAAVMENNLTSDRRLLGLLGGDNQAIAEREVRKELAKFQDPAQRGALEIVARDHDREAQAINQARAEIARLNQEMLLLIDRGAPASEIAARQSQIEALALTLPGVAETPEESLLRSASVPVVSGNTGAPGAAQAGPAPAGSPAAPMTPADQASRLLAQYAAPPAAPPEGVDSRIFSVNNLVRDIGAGFTSGLDRTAGLITATAGRGLNNVSRIGGYGVGIFAPEFGSEMLANNDRMSETLDRLAAEGFVRDQPNEAAPAEAASLPQADADFVVQTAQADPVSALTAVAMDLNISNQEMEQVIQAVQALERDAVPDDQQNAVRRQIQEFFDRAAERSSAASPEVRALLERSTEWLNY